MIFEVLDFFEVDAPVPVEEGSVCIPLIFLCKSHREDRIQLHPVFFSVHPDFSSDDRVSGQLEKNSSLKVEEGLH